MYSRSRLRELIDAQGRTVNWLADITDYNPSTISRFLTGADPITDKFATRAARALGVPVDWLRDESVVATEAVPA